MKRKTRWFVRIQTLLLLCLLIALGVKYNVIDTDQLRTVIGDRLAHIKQWLTSLLS